MLYSFKMTFEILGESGRVKNEKGGFDFENQSR